MMHPGGERENSAGGAALRRRVLGGWLGKSVGGTLGLPAEGQPGPLDFTYYRPVPTSAPPNDDLELQLVWLHVLETRGPALAQLDLADGWRRHIHYMWDEYGRCRWNLRRGVPLAAVGTFENWFTAGMGSPIRSEVWACLAAGEPALAAAYAALDASLDHGAEGIAGEVFLASLQSRVLGGADLRPSLAAARADLSGATEVAAAVDLALATHRAGLSAWEAYGEIVRAHRADNFTHAPLNLGLIAWALLHGEGDFSASVLLATNCGYDTDCTAATVGATLGMLLGPEGIEERWRRPIGDGIHCGAGIVGINAARTLQELTDRILRVRESRLAAGGEPATPPPAPAVDLASLPGTIWLRPLDGGPSVPFANGELPPAILAAGGAEWDWTPGPETARGAYLRALARPGCQLFLDGQPLIQCPGGQPFVPAVHRFEPGTCARVVPSAPVHRLRLELASRAPAQEAAVILADLSMHLTTWDGVELPDRPTLPDRNF